jgi:hypothetical protein
MACFFPRITGAAAIPQQGGGSYEHQRNTY